MRKEINKLKLFITGLTLCAVTLLNATTDVAGVDGIVNIDLSENTQGDGNSSSEKQLETPCKKFLIQGRKKWIDGYLDQAINVVQKARKLTPKNMEIRKTLKSMQIQKKMLDDVLMQTGRLIEQKKFDRAERALAKAGYISKKYSPYREMEKRLKNTQKISSSPQKSANANYIKSFAGIWSSTFGFMKLTVQDLLISGSYDHDRGRIEAVLSQNGKTMEGTWAEAPSYKGSRDSGKMHFELSGDGNKIDGTWSYGDAVPTHSWTATRFVVAQPQLPETVNPRQKLPKKPSIKKSDGSKYIGCYRDTTSKEGIEDRDLNGYYYISDSMSTKECATTCALKGFDYAGTQFSYVCFCGNSYGGNGAADNCNMPCSGSKNEICGGDLANSVYALTSTISSFVGTWSFGYSRHYGKQEHEHLYDLVLTTDKHIKGGWLYHIRSCSLDFPICTINRLDYVEVHACDADQSFWLPREKGLAFFGCDYQVTTFFTEVRPGYWEGVYTGGPHKGEDIVYYLEKKLSKETNATHIKSNQVKDAENE